VLVFLSHARPVDEAQAALWKRLAENELATPDTWEVALSAAGRGDGQEKREVWERLLAERKMGALALLRNLRNLHAAGVSEELVLSALAALKTERVLPFRFLAAARNAPQWKRRLKQQCSGRSRPARESWQGTRWCWWTSPDRWSRRCRRGRDAAHRRCVWTGDPASRDCGEGDDLYLFRPGPAGGFTPRNGAARCAGKEPTSLGNLPGCGAQAGGDRSPRGYDRLVVITDEQSHDSVPAPKGVGYVINVASAQNGVGYGAWTHVDG